MKAYRLSSNRLVNYLRNDSRHKDIWVVNAGKHIPRIVISEKEIPELADYECYIGQWGRKSEGRAGA